MYQRRLEAIERLRDADAASILRDNRVGLEKESLRVDLDGHIARTPHPRALGSALTHPYITTDFSEALLEFVTPPFADARETLRFLAQVHQFVYSHLDDEVLWCASMPCMVRGDESVPIANYGSSNVGQMKRVYREGLSLRYGRVMQTIAGIHFNFSLAEAIWPVLYPDANGPAAREAIDSAYFGGVRNFQRLGWLVSYLFGTSPALCKSFLGDRSNGFERFDNGTLYMPYATSLRMSDVGYKSSNQSGLAIDYSSVDAYVKSLSRAIETPYPQYEALGVKVDGRYRQLNANVLQIENEFYSFIRPKQIARSGEKPTLALHRRGVQYLEIRALDVNPFEPLGVSDDTMYFLEALVVFCILLDSPPIDGEERVALERNQLTVTTRGRDPQAELDLWGRRAPVSDHAAALLDAMTPVCELLDTAQGSARYTRSLAVQQAAVADPALLPSARVLEAMGQQSVPFFRFAMNLSKAHRDHFLAMELPAEQAAMLDEEAARSLEQQREIEASDSISFDEYLRRYFAQTLDQRESLLG